MDVKELPAHCRVKLVVKGKPIFRDKGDVWVNQYESLVKIFNYRIKNIDDAKELAQTVFEKYCRERFVLVEGKELALLAMIASYALKDYYKKEHNRVGRVQAKNTRKSEDGLEEEFDVFDFIESEIHVDPERYALLDETKKSLERFINMSSPRERSVATAFWLKDGTVDEVAVELGITKSNVYTQISNMRKDFVSYCKECNILLPERF